MRRVLLILVLFLLTLSSCSFINEPAYIHLEDEITKEGIVHAIIDVRDGGYHRLYVNNHIIRHEELCPLSDGESMAYTIFKDFVYVVADIDPFFGKNYLNINAYNIETKEFELLIEDKEFNPNEAYACNEKIYISKYSNKETMYGVYYFDVFDCSLKYYGEIDKKMTLRKYLVNEKIINKKYECSIVKSDGEECFNIKKLDDDSIKLIDRSFISKTEFNEYFDKFISYKPVNYGVFDDKILIMYSLYDEEPFLTDGKYSNIIFSYDFDKDSIEFELLAYISLDSISFCKFAYLYEDGTSSFFDLHWYN